MADSLTALGRYAVKMDHIAIAVPDLEIAIAFYQKQLGFQLIERRTTLGQSTGMISAVMNAGAVIVVLIQGTSPESQVNRYIADYGPGVQHIAIEVRDVDELKREMSQVGVEFNTEIIEGCGIRQAFTARDPASGMMYEFIERRTNDGTFSDESVKQLFDQLERKGAY
jgi:methylmalonyl-CoA/ethylmalonyl-CoA epimerase